MGAYVYVSLTVVKISCWWPAMWKENIMGHSELREQAAADLFCDGDALMPRKNDDRGNRGPRVGCPNAIRYESHRHAHATVSS